MFMQTLEKRMFKKTPAGYVFQFPPSRFRPTDAVLVTAAQKEDILAITRKSSPGKRLLPLLAAVAMGILAGRTASAISDMPTFGSAVFGFSVGFATLIVAIELAWSRKLMALQPLLKGLPRSAERLFPAAPLRLRSVPPAE